MTDVSVVIPVRDGEPFVAEAVESVLDQEDVRAELIVADDGSTDGTPDVLARFAERIVVRRQEERGLAAARNVGLALAHAELIVFLDADDLQPPGYLARLVETATATPDAEVFHCGWRATDFDGRFLYEQESPLDLDRDPLHALAAAGSPHISTLAVRRRAADRVGPFDETLPHQEDWDYWLRLALSGAIFKGVPGNVAIIRRRADSMSASAGPRLAATGLAVLEKHLSRHERCPACIQADAGLASWRRAVLQASARDYARRLRLRGRAGRLIGGGLAVARTPRLAPTAWLALRERVRQ